MLRALVVLAITAIGLTAAVRSRFAALLLYVWYALFRPLEWIWIDLSALRLSLVTGLVLVVPCFLTGVLPDVSHPLSLLSIAFFGSALVAQPGAVSPDIGWAWIDYLGRLLLVCLLAVRILSTPRRFTIALAVAAGSFGFHSAKAGLASILGGGVRFYDGLAGGAFVDNNGYALGAAMTVFLLVAAGQNLGNRWVRRGFFLAAPLTAYAIVALFSRGGFLALAASTLVFVLLQRRRVAILAALAGLAFMAWLIVPLPPGYLERLDTISKVDEVSDESAQSRRHFWSVAVDMARERPAGVGLYNYSAAYDQFDSSEGRYGHARAVHSSHFQVLAELGFAGLGIYLATFATAFALLLRIRRRARSVELAAPDARLFLTAANGLMASMTAFLVGGAFIAVALNDLTWLSFAFTAALDRISRDALSAARKKAEKSREDARVPSGVPRTLGPC